MSLLVSAAVAYVGAFVLLLGEVVLKRHWRRATLVLGWVGLVLHGAAIATLWLAVGHGPIITRYENLSSYAWATAVIALITITRRRSLKPLGLFLLPLSFILLGIAAYAGPEVANMPPTFRGVWLVVHVVLYFSAFGAAAVAVSASMFVALPAAVRSMHMAWVPEADELDLVAYRYGGAAFALWGAGMLAGSVWAYSAWGRYWGWDPIETWSLVTWLVLGVYLHLRRFFAWSGRRAAVLLVIAFALVLVSLFGTALVSDSIHSVYFS
ncbi:MAG: cytochrome c biogenesis protein CcsA [Coriobacteriia bacterium]|nr:cytochrome c biogenesis protein CcsA [Coriobacteriia bacterium]MBN2839963.1 cytochrome c biogenesis protein CcsA [Coriobacteriia bacterium]